MRKAKFIISTIVFFFSLSQLNAQVVKNVMIFPFSTKGKDIPEASIGVLSSVMNYLKFLPTAKFTKSDFDIKNREIKEVIKLFPTYDEFIIGKYQKDKDTFIYEINIYDKSGEIKNSFSASSEDLFEIVDTVVSRISSYYGGGTRGFAILNFKSQLPQDNTFTLLLNDEILSQIKGSTNFSQRIISKTPYNIILRNDKTKEVILKKEITLLDNEAVDIELKEPEPKKEVITNIITNVTTEKVIEVSEGEKTISRYQAYKDIVEGITTYKIFDNNAFKILQDEASILDRETKLDIYNRFEIKTYLPIISSLLNTILPGSGSLVIGDSGGFLIALLTPYLTFFVFLATSQENGAIATSSLVITIGGYIYNLIRPFEYQAEWNGRLKKLLSIDTKASLLKTKEINLSMNIMNIKF